MFLYPNNNNYFANSFHIGCFASFSYNKPVTSRKKSTERPRTDAKVNIYFKYAYDKGDDYDLMSFQQWTYLQALFVLLFKSTNCQTAHSMGLGRTEEYDEDDDYYIYHYDYCAGLSTNKFGMSGKVGNRYTRMAFFWIHSLWGGTSQNVGGIWYAGYTGYSGSVYYWLPRQANQRAWCPTTAWYSSSTVANQSNLGSEITGIGESSGDIRRVNGTNKGGFLITVGAGSAYTYYCDTGEISSRNGTSGAMEAFFSATGGGTVGDMCGIFYDHIAYKSTSISGGTARLSYRGGH